MSEPKSHPLTASAGAYILTCTLAAILVFVWWVKWNRKEILHPTSDLVASRKTQKWWSLGSSFFAAALGCSALSANPEAGADSGWIAVFSYGLANALPYWILIPLGPALMRPLGDSAISLGDFVRSRYGRGMQILTALFALFFMWVWLTAELTSAGSAFTVLCDGFVSYGATIPIALVSFIYAMIAGLRVSIITDRLQTVVTILTLGMIMIGASVYCVREVSSEAWHSVAKVKGSDFNTAGVLIISTVINEFLDFGVWQRVIAADSEHHARLGLLSGGAANFIAQALVTFLGMIAASEAAAGALIMPIGMEFNAFFYMLEYVMPKWWSVIALIMIVAMSTSTADSIENAFASLVASDLLKHNASLNWARLFATLVMIPSIIVAATNRSVLDLFLVSNILACTLVPPILLGLTSRKYATNIGALAGVLIGLISIFLLGLIYEDGDAIEALKWVLLPRGFSDTSTLISFIVVPIVSALTTLAVSAVDVIGVERRRKLSMCHSGIKDQDAGFSESLIIASSESESLIIASSEAISSASSTELLSSVAVNNSAPTSGSCSHVWSPVTLSSCSKDVS